MSGHQSELTDCRPMTMTGMAACWVGGSWFWFVVVGGVEVDEDEAEVSDDDNRESSAVANVDRCWN